MAQQAISLKPEDMSTGSGGILADTNARWDKVYFGMETYQGKAAPVPAFMIEYTDLDTGEEFKQSWSVGNADDYTPSQNGKQLLGSKTVRASSNFGMLMASLSNAIGAEEFTAQITDDVTVLASMETHFFQQLDERPTAKERVDKKSGKKYPATIPLVDRVMVKPWDKKGTRSAPEAAGDLHKTAAELIKKVLAEKPEGLGLQPLAVAVFQTAEVEDEVKANLVTLISNESAFVSGIDGVVLENGVFKLG